MPVATTADRAEAAGCNDGTAPDWRAVLTHFDSAQRLYDLEVEGGPAALWVESFAGYEALSAFSDYRIVALSTDARLELAGLRWRRAWLRIRNADGSRQIRSGHLRGIRALGADGGLARYELQLVPWNWLLTQQQHARVWQAQPLGTILGDVFAAYADADWQLADDLAELLATRPIAAMRVQYAESDHAFIDRLLREEGLGWCHVESGEPGRTSRLVIFADSTRIEPDPGLPDGIRFHRADGTDPGGTIQRFESVNALTSQFASLVAFDPDAKCSHAEAVTGSAIEEPEPNALPAPLLPPLERYRWHGHGGIGNRSEASHRVKLMLEALEAKRELHVAEGAVPALRIGMSFGFTPSRFEHADASVAVADAPASELRLLPLRLCCAGLNNLPSRVEDAAAALAQAAGSAWLPVASDDQTGPAAQEATTRVLANARMQGYAMRVLLQPADRKWRPDRAGERAQRPAPGPQSAVVVDAGGSGNSGDTVHRDRLGRIRVRFHWQQAASSATDHRSAATCWLRVASRTAGPGRGQSFVPRLGQEVLVGFLDGDIEQPIVLGALYNGRGEGGAASGVDGDGALFASARDGQPTAQGNTAGGNSPAWHGASADAEGHGNPAAISGIKTQGFGGTASSNQLALDDRDLRQRVQLKTTQAGTELNLGHLVHQADNHLGSVRGSGFELRSDGGGVIRAARGLLIESRRGSDRAEVPEPIGDFTAGSGLMSQARSLAGTFDAAAMQHRSIGLASLRGVRLRAAGPMDPDDSPLAALAKATAGTVPADAARGALALVPHASAAIVALSAHAQLAVTATQDLQIAAGETIVTSSGRDTTAAIGGALRIHSLQGLGLLSGIVEHVQQPGLSAIAAAGPLRIEAQAGSMNIDANGELQLCSLSDRLDLAAKTAVTLCTKAGATIRISDGNIDIHCPGTISVHAAEHDFAGPVGIAYPLPSFMPASFCLTCFLHAAKSGGALVPV